MGINGDVLKYFNTGLGAPFRFLVLVLIMNLDFFEERS